MNEDEPHNDSFEAKLREMARQLGRTIERAVDEVDLDDIASRIGMESERMKEFAELAGRWLGEQFPDAGDPASGDPASDTDAASPAEAPPHSGRRSGPHPLDVPTEEQGLALSGLSSGRWKVESGTDVLVADGEGPGPTAPSGVVGELRARDWITASGELTVVGEDALRRWLARSETG